MAYKIEYDNSSKKYEIISTYPLRFPLFLVICYMIFLLITVTFWQDGKAFIQELLIPGDNESTIEAFHAMTEDLREGASVHDALYTFCNEIIDGT